MTPNTAPSVRVKRGHRIRVAAPLFRLPAVVLLPIVLATFAFAHAVLVGSSPSPDSTVKGPDVEISLKFNVRIDVARSRLELMLPGNTEKRLPVREGKAANLMLANATNLAPGKYKLLWQVLASDGHITRGEIAFSVQ
jgi:methionine-rich copper-binding protein CopC